MRKIGYGVAVVLGLFVLLVVWSRVQANDPEVQERRREEQKIALCYSHTKDELQARETRLATRDACRVMEEQFVKKYGRPPL